MQAEELLKTTLTLFWFICLISLLQPTADTLTTAGPTDVTPMDTRADPQVSVDDVAVPTTTATIGNTGTITTAPATEGVSNPNAGAKQEELEVPKPADVADSSVAAAAPDRKESDDSFDLVDAAPTTSNANATTAPSGYVLCIFLPSCPIR